MDYDNDALKYYRMYAYDDQFLGQAYRAMIPNTICVIKDNNNEGREYIDLATYVFKGMPAEVKQQYKELLERIMEIKQTSIYAPDFWQKLHSVYAVQADAKLGNELNGVFRILSLVVDDAKKARVSEGKSWFDITEEEIMTAMGIEQLDDILSAVYYPRTELVQQHYDKVVSDKFHPFGVFPLISEQNKAVKR